MGEVSKETTIVMEGAPLTKGAYGLVEAWE